MINSRFSKRIAGKYKSEPCVDIQKFRNEYNDLDKQGLNSDFHANLQNNDVSPPKQSKLATLKNESKVSPPCLEKLSINSPAKTKHSRKSLFPEKTSHHPKSGSVYKENQNSEQYLINDKTNLSLPKNTNKIPEQELENGNSRKLGRQKLKIISSSSDDTSDEEDSPLRNKSQYLCARQALHGTLPSEMPGREKEFEQLRVFIEDNVTKKTSASLYISGPPGTGKTASLNLLLKKENLDAILTIVYVNCTAIKSPTAIYSRIVKELKLKQLGKTEKDHLTQIDTYLRKKHKPILLILDEIDQLENKNQSILYTIFEWPAKPNSHLLLIGIANALDLTDRILPRLQARCELKPQLMHFTPYSKSQIIEIFTSRLKSAGVLEIFSPAAVQMLAGKVAAISGDVRRALDIGRRVVEMADQSRKTSALKSVENLANQLVEEETKTVELNQVLSVLNTVYSTSQNLNDNTEDSFPLQQKIVLCSLLLMLNKFKNKDVTIGKLHEVYRKVCDKRKISSVDQAEFVGLCSLIETKGMISVSGKKEARLQKVNLMWDQQEVTNALKDKQLIADILRD